MRDTILTSLLLASAAALTSAVSLECLQTRSEELAAAASCGHKGSLNYCFANLPLSTQPEALADKLERCFVGAGCTPSESKIESVFVMRRCDAASPDLRRARRQPDSDDSLLAAAKEEEPLLAPRAALPAMITAMLLPRQTPTNNNAPTPAAATSQSSPSPCFTDSTTTVTTCPVQTTGADAGKKLDCFQTAIVSAVCREGLICQSDNQGNPSCMFKQSGLGIDGIIIAVVFAGALVISLVSVCIFCCRERAEHKRLDRAAEAARIAKEAKTQATVAAKRPGVSVTGGVGGGAAAVEGQPLMYQTGGGAGGGSSSPGPQQTSFGQQHMQLQQQPGYGAANPFADGEHEGHPLS